jgi:hypothetical protein
MHQLNEDVILYIASYLLDIKDIVSLSVVSKDYLFMRNLSFVKKKDIYLTYFSNIIKGNRRCTYNLLYGYHGPQYIYINDILNGYFEYHHNKRIIQIFKHSDSKFYILFIINDIVYSQYRCIPIVEDINKPYLDFINNVVNMSIINNEKINECTSKYFGRFESKIDRKYWSYHDK